ncbi:Low density lipoprotein receptor class A cysteine rich [Schistosoma japonicum]|nr:Low density lipoprotein receptor class A cysteine rich [Schistosoma japonicum]KAH8860947.1 Low density lipoprotein receptor class A cysteine rich [Schistosoma japonicum]
MKNLFSWTIVYQLLVAIWPVLALSKNNNDNNGNCGKSFQFKSNKIILTQKSISAGAKFLKKLKVASFKECYFKCCSTSECSTAVFESEATQSCFLFDCRPPGQCFYSSHSNYDLILLEELSNNQSVKNRVGLNQYCDSNNLCDGIKTICSDGICVCQSGWIAKKGSCVQSVCKSPELQFQCDDSSTCVAIYDKCNGIVECPDESDELLCPSKVIRKENETKSSSVIHHKQKELDERIFSKISPNESYHSVERIRSGRPSSFLTTSRSNSPAMIDLHSLSDSLFYSSNQRSYQNNNNDREQQLTELSHPFKDNSQKPLFDVDKEASFMLDIHDKNVENNDNNPEVFFTPNDDAWRYPKGLLDSDDLPQQALPGRKHLYRTDHRLPLLLSSRIKPYEAAAGVYKPRSAFNTFKVNYPQPQKDDLSFIPYHSSSNFLHGASHRDGPSYFKHSIMDRKRPSDLIIDPTIFENMDFLNKFSETEDSFKKHSLIHGMLCIYVFNLNVCSILYKGLERMLSV